MTKCTRESMCERERERERKRERERERETETEIKRAGEEGFFWDLFIVIVVIVMMVK